MSASRPAPLSSLPGAAARHVRGLLTDIDDTLTRDGRIEPEALAALHDLRSAGVPVIAVTGRPMGWSRDFAETWPLEAIVAENGAVALFTDNGKLVTEYAQDESTRAANAVRLEAAAERVLREVPGSTLARDSAGRVTDIAIDHSEFAHLEPAQIAQVVAVMRAEGMNATVSSIHVNGWYGEHDKLSGARWIVGRRLGRDARRRDRALGLRRRLDQRPADVRPLPAQRRRRQPAALRRQPDGLAGLPDRAASAAPASPRSRAA